MKRALKKEHRQRETAAPRERHRVLVVDDDEGCREFLKALLEFAGYQGTLSNTGFEAVRLFSTDPDYFDLVILDQEMPGLTGTEVARRLVSLRPAVSMLLYTGSPDDDLRNVARTIGIKEVVRKPLPGKELLRVIERILDGAPRKPNLA